MEALENPEEEQQNERERLRMRISVLEESVRSCELDCKTSRETVVRLVAELDQERRKATNSAAALDSIKVELDGMTLGRRSVEVEKQTLMERLQASKRVIDAARKESDCLEKQVEELEKKLQISQAEAEAAQRKLQTFLEKVSARLQGGCENILQPTERDILRRMDHICNKAVSDMELKLCRVSEELSRQTELQHGAEHRAQLAEQQVHDLREKLHRLETELLTADVQRDGLRHNKEHYEEFLQRLSEIMKVDGIAVDVGFHMRLNLILTRAEQLVKQEGTTLVENKTLTYSLQRKLKFNKDQLQSKELHIQLLRKKLSELEEEKKGRSALAVERDDARLETRKLQKKVECLQGKLKASKTSNTELKAQLSHTNELKLKIMEQNKTMQEQRKTVAELVEGKIKMEKKLDTMSLELLGHEKQSHDDHQQLHTLRQTLAQLSERERELFDLQRVVSEMLGLDATAMALPNYEIIKLLENLLHCHHHPYHVHHHHSVPWHCPSHQVPYLPQTWGLTDSSSLDISAGMGGAAPLHES